jgi:hypothetical protein
VVAAVAGGRWVAALVVLAAGIRADDHLDRVLARLAEEAEAFRTAAPTVLAEETLKQRAAKKPSRFRPRIGGAATRPPELKFQRREIVSEYSFSTFRESPNVLHEFRQVISVDGRPVTTHEKARQTLAIGMRSADDRLKKRLLHEFEKHGLVGAATDFGQVILLFEKRRQGGYEFGFAGKQRIGAESAVVFSFRQTEGEGVTIIEGRNMIRRPLAGEIWAREEDGLPLRVQLVAVREQDGQTIRDEATIDYVQSQHGFLAPAAVTHRQIAGGQLVVENIYQYSPFRKFSAEAEIKFTEVPLEPVKP